MIRPRGIHIPSLLCANNTHILHKNGGGFPLEFNHGKTPPRDDKETETKGLDHEYEITRDTATGTVFPL